MPNTSSVGFADKNFSPVKKNPAEAGFLSVIKMRKINAEVTVQSEAIGSPETE